ncbi:DUF1525 domain-containing protein [Motilimonas eburnea]|uniref:DUF1525 domain-containing protein n=1 Tax=Motilimonas eburnea TaxID=1737488 RepID=UPI001E2A2CDD|nr:DUF1525 domain-containing protein [Motilimonas eburnea]MCE2573851.1 DUF1525 domain-containing protein [Motilimonas eburnea]
MIKSLVSLSALSMLALSNCAAASTITPCTQSCEFNSVEVFELSGVPVDTSTTSSKNIHIYRVNLLDKVEEKLSMGMSEVTTTADATNLINQKSVQERNHYYGLMKAGWRNLIRADYFGISKVPAVVFDHQYVIYGESLPRAIEIYRSKRGQQ